MSALSYGWPDGEVAGAQCPVAPGTDTVTIRDTKLCSVRSIWMGLCPCAAVLAFGDPKWQDYDANGNGLPQEAGR
jgi:hypothetical protein